MKNIKRELHARDLVSQFLEYYGENVKRPGLIDTPKRVVKMYEELLAGYDQDLDSLVKTFDSNGYDELVTVANLSFYSLCEHHMIPFFGKVYIGYVPDKTILGLSKFARLVDAFSRRLQTQENLTKQIADCIEKYLNPKGLIVQIEAEHLCVSMRGIKKENFLTKTVIRRGLLKNKYYINQFYRVINQKKDGSK